MITLGWSGRRAPNTGQQHSAATSASSAGAVPSAGRSLRARSVPCSRELLLPPGAVSRLSFGLVTEALQRLAWQYVFCSALVFRVVKSQAAAGGAASQALVVAERMPPQACRQHEAAKSACLECSPAAGQPLASPAAALHMRRSLAAAGGQIVLATAPGTMAETSWVPVETAKVAFLNSAQQRWRDTRQAGSTAGLARSWYQAAQPQRVRRTRAAFRPAATCHAVEP